MGQDVYIFLGKFNKGKHKLTPELVFKVTIASGKDQNSFEFSFNPKDPTAEESRFAQTVVTARSVCLFVFSLALGQPLVP
jgi:hypothetical protein